MPFYIQMKGNNYKITLHNIHTRLKGNSTARKSQQAMKAYRWDFFFKYTYINKEQHTIEKNYKWIENMKKKEIV